MSWLRNARGSKRWSYTYACSIVAITFIVFLTIPLPKEYEDPRNALMEQFADAASSVKSGSYHTSATLSGIKSKYAYATFLASDWQLQNDENINHDKYFVATRILAYQILHAPETKSNNDVPFIVLVNKDVSEAKRDRLRKDGAIVYEPEPVDGKWIHTAVANWQTVLAKLRLWELTQFERICFLDGDTVLTKSIDGIFEDSAVQAQRTGNNQEATRSDEGKQPTDYVFAGVPEMMEIHRYPPTEEGHDFPNYGYLNAGFFVLQPSLGLLGYYLSLMETPDRFPPDLPEQNLLNYAHRPEGNMPWVHLDTRWNIHYPTVQDLQGGVASLHEKWWAPLYPDLQPYLESWRWRMEGYYEARETYLVKHDS